MWCETGQHTMCGFDCTMHDQKTCDHIFEQKTPYVDECKFCHLCRVRASSEKMIEELREEFEDLFPKDQEAIDGIRPSASNRSAALVLWAKFMCIIEQVKKENEASALSK